MTDHLGALPYERNVERNGYRNGYRPRTIYTRVGPVTLRVPQSRDGSFSTDIFRRYQRSEQTLVLGIMEMYINGVSTRKVTAITEELCGVSFSKSTVSQLCVELDARVSAWNERRLDGHVYPFLIVGALGVKARRNDAVRSTSALIAIKVKDQGIREILGVWLGDSETEGTWEDMFVWLKSRGLNVVDSVVSDSQAGLVKAVERIFQGASWQRCQCHFQGNVLSRTPPELQSEMAAGLRRIFSA